MIKKVMMLCLVSILSYTNVSYCNEENNSMWSEFTCILGVSTIPGAGIGLFATHDIPAGTIIYHKPSERRTMKIKDVPQAFHKYLIYLNDEECQCPMKFNHMEVGWYINHSDNPNIRKIEGGALITRDIKAGDELCIDYNQFDEPEHLKEAYYKPTK